MRIRLLCCRSYAPAKLPPAKPTEQEAALASVKSLDALEIMGKLIYNAAVQVDRAAPPGAPAPTCTAP
jgi:hypothetical protein